MGQIKHNQFSQLQPTTIIDLSFTLRLTVVIFSLCIFSGCSTAEKPVAEAPPAQVNTPTDQPPQPQVTNAPVAQVNEVERAVARVFKGSVLIDTDRKPSFTVGDFNGDLSQDLAVVLKPAAEKLSALNEEFPAWMLRDLSGPIDTDGPRLRVKVSDVLLAVIHGYGSTGWRAPEATQTFLLKNAAGSGLNTQTAKVLAAANKGKKLPQFRGDVIGEEIGGTSGFLYYAGASYSWYDPKTFNGDEAARGMVHTARRLKPAK